MRDDDDECGVVDGMRIGMGNRSTRNNPAQVPLYPPRIPHGMSWERTRAAAVGIRRLTAWAMVRPCGINSMELTLLWIICDGFAEGIKLWSQEAPLLGSCVNRGAVFSVVCAALVAPQRALNSFAIITDVFCVIRGVPCPRQRSRKHAFLISRDTCFPWGLTGGYITSFFIARFLYIVLVMYVNTGNGLKD
jgi:hypothetical protein